MSKLRNFSLGVSSLQNFKELNDKVKAVINSKLTDEEKNKAIQSFKKLMRTTVLFTLFICLIILVGVVGIIYSISKNSDLGIAMAMGLLVLAVVALIIYALMSRKKFSDWTKYSTIVEYGWDGLSEEEVAKLKPSQSDNEAIKKYQQKNIIAGILLIVAFTIEFSILLNIGVEVQSPLTITIVLITTIVWYIFQDGYNVEINRLKSGYYKKSFGFKCSHCSTPVEIKFEEIEKYESLPKDINGIKVMKCPKCNNDVQFFNFDNALKDYKKYKSQNKSL